MLLACRGEYFLEDMHVLAAPLIEEGPDSLEREGLKKSTTPFIVFADRALKQSSTVIPRSSFSLTEERLRMSVSLMPLVYGEVQYFVLVPLDAFDFNTGDYFLGVRESAYVAVFLVEDVLTRVFDGQLVPGIE